MPRPGPFDVAATLRSLLDAQAAAIARAGADHKAAEGIAASYRYRIEGFRRSLARDFEHHRNLKRSTANLVTTSPRGRRRLKIKFGLTISQQQEWQSFLDHIECFKTRDGGSLRVVSQPYDLMLAGHKLLLARQV